MTMLRKTIDIPGLLTEQPHIQTRVMGEAVCILTCVYTAAGLSEASAFECTKSIILSTRGGWAMPEVIFVVPP